MHAKSTDPLPAELRNAQQTGRNEVVVAGMPAARAWLVGRNAARGAHGWNRLPGSSATVWSRRAVLSRAGGYVQKFRTLPGFPWVPGSARQASCGGFRCSWAETSALTGLPAAHCDGCDRGRQFVRHSRAPPLVFSVQVALQQNLVSVAQFWCAGSQNRWHLATSRPHPASLMSHGLGRHTYRPRQRSHAYKLC